MKNLKISIECGVRSSLIEIFIISTYYFPVIIKTRHKDFITDNKKCIILINNKVGLETGEKLSIIK